MLTKIISAFCASVLLLVAVDLSLPRGEAKVYKNVIRLHVVAESDSDTDQAVKLKVRDAILNEYSSFFSSASDTESAADGIYQKIGEIKALADKVLRENGVDYRSEVIFGRENYPEKQYGDLVFPSGEYLSLRVNLGSASGENWWCVLFPPLCVSSCSDLSAAGIDKNGEKVLKNKKYTFRFKILELFG